MGSRTNGLLDIMVIIPLYLFNVVQIIVSSSRQVVKKIGSFQARGTEGLRSRPELVVDGGRGSADSMSGVRASDVGSA